MFRSTERFLRPLHMNKHARARTCCHGGQDRQFLGKVHSSHDSPHSLDARSDARKPPASCLHPQHCGQSDSEGH